MPPSPTFVRPVYELERTSLGKYDLHCRLSTGGMSEIFLASQKGAAGFRKIVVLKSILPDIRGEEEFVRMFLEEARTTAALNHPNIAHVFDLDTADGILFLAMEFVQGCTLVELARACRQGKEGIPLGLTLTAVRDTALALNYAHNFTDVRGRKQIIIHRDVAEKNIMVSYDGTTKLLDFGIAKALGRRGANLTSVGMVKGTSGYMSPEQIRGEPLDARSDIFALGVVLHECLTGMRLFHGKNAEEGMLAALREDVQPPSRLNPEVSPALDEVCLKALRREREQRWSTALEFARAIEKACPGALWYPEQCGEYVLKFFADRRMQTRELLEAAQGDGEFTGEVRIDKVLAQVGIAREATPAPQPAVVKPSGEDSGKLTKSSGVVPIPARKPTLGVAPKASAPPPPVRASNATLPPVRASGVAQQLPPAKPLPRAHTIEIKSEFDDDDDQEMKTVPAAALPQEIVELARQRRAAAASQERETQSSGTPYRNESVVTTPGVLPVELQKTQHDATTRPSNGSVSQQGPWVPPADTNSGARTMLERPNRGSSSPSAETNPERAGVDRDDDEQQTSIGTPGESLASKLFPEGGAGIGVQTDPQQFRASHTWDESADDAGDEEDRINTHDDDDDYDTRSEPATNATQRKSGGSKWIGVAAAAGVLLVGGGLFAIFGGGTSKPPPPEPLSPMGGGADTVLQRAKEPVVEKPKAPEAPALAKPEKPAEQPAEAPAPVAEVKPPAPEPVAEVKKPEVAAAPERPSPVKAREPDPVPEKPERQPVRVAEKKPALKPRAEAPAGPSAAVSIFVEQPARVLFNGKDLGTTPPIIKTNLPVGTHSLKLIPVSGGAAKKVSVDVKPTGGTFRFDLED